jgi:hypothetical protein
MEVDKLKILWKYMTQIIGMKSRQLKILWKYMTQIIGMQSGCFLYYKMEVDNLKYFGNT